MSFSDREKRLGKGKAKKISVIVPNYNYAQYLKWRMTSIAGQTYPIYEMIVLDDASTDGSKTAIKMYAPLVGQSHPETKLRLMWNKKNSGKAISQWRKGVEEAKGDYIWIAEVDDISRKDFLAEVMKGFSDPEVVISYAESAIINKYGILTLPNFRRSRDREGTGHYAKSYIRPGKQEIEEIMAIRCTIPNVSGVVFKNTPELHKYLKLAEKFEQVGDWFLYVKLLESGKIFYNHRSMNFFRIHGGSATKRGAEHVKEIVLMHNYFKNKYNLSKDVLAAMDAELERIRRKYGIIK